ncbi:MAG: hypothetical protein GEV09_11035 [Pseudonocardiaceae bacterium]|nr:hypothetical protein [Pseudonocardiaceae bacterium]
MGIAKPDLIRASTPVQPSAGTAHCRPEYEPKHEPERAPAREAPETDDGHGLVGGRVLTFPAPPSAAATDSHQAQLLPAAHTSPDTAPCARAEPRTLVARAGVVSTRWAAEARDSGRAALDGSVWRSRPAALRDVRARIARAEWAGDLDALRVAGQLYGYYVALPLVAGLYALAELVKRPSRVAIAVLVVLMTVLPIVLAI